MGLEERYLRKALFILFTLNSDLLCKQWSGLACEHRRICGCQRRATTAGGNASLRLSVRRLTAVKPQPLNVPTINLPHFSHACCNPIRNERALTRSLQCILPVFSQALYRRKASPLNQQIQPLWLSCKKGSCIHIGSDIPPHRRMLGSTRKGKKEVIPHI